MIRHRVTEEPGVWRLVHETEPRRKITLHVFEAPGMRERTIEIIADGGVRIDGKVIMSALTPRERAPRSPKPVDALMADIAQVAQEVADVSGVTVDEMRGPVTIQRVSRARKVAMFLSQRRLAITHADVGKFFNRERSVVSTGIADVERQIETPDTGRLTRLVTK